MPNLARGGDAHRGHDRDRDRDRGDARAGLRYPFRGCAIRSKQMAHTQGLEPRRPRTAACV